MPRSRARSALRTFAGTTAHFGELEHHTLRHSAAPLLLAQGVPSAVILDVLGHQDLRMLRRYQHVTDSLRQDAADAIGRSSLVHRPVNDEAPDQDPGATWGGA